jgi:hypothetical protein
MRHQAALRASPSSLDSSTFYWRCTPRNMLGAQRACALFPPPPKRRASCAAGGASLSPGVKPAGTPPYLAASGVHERVSMTTEFNTATAVGPHGKIFYPGKRTRLERPSATCSRRCGEPLGASDFLIRRHRSVTCKNVCDHGSTTLSVLHDPTSS